MVPPASQTVTMGQASFSVTATAAAPLSYQWNKNGAAISGATSAAYSQTPSSLPLSSDNIAMEVEKAGKTRKDYVETGNGCGAVNSGISYMRDDPLEYFTNINKANVVCFSQFSTDLANKTLPNLSWLSPNGIDDGHDTSASTFDRWLKTIITPLLASSYSQPGGDGLLIVTWDENASSGSPNCSTTTVGQGCGGQVETVLISARSKPGYQSTAGDPANYNNTYDAANFLRTIAEALGTEHLGTWWRRYAAPWPTSFSDATVNV